MPNFDFSTPDDIEQAEQKLETMRHALEDARSQITDEDKEYLRVLRDRRR